MLFFHFLFLHLLPQGKLFTNVILLSEMIFQYSKNCQAVIDDLHLWFLDSAGCLCVCVCAGYTNFLLSLARLAGVKSMPFISFSKRQKFLDTEELWIPELSLSDKHRAQRRQWTFPGSPYPHFTDGEPKSLSPCSLFQPANCRLVLAALPFPPG